MRLSLPAGLLTLALLASGCDSGDLGSLPPPGTYPLLHIEQALDAPAGRYNVDGFLDRIVCEDDTADCIPGTHWLYESPVEDPPQHAALLLTVEEPDAFREDVRYLLSIETEVEPSDQLRTFFIIGAERVDD